ncbi:MAG: hydrogenase maturation protease [Deltaproteobacteria bacterium]|nr:hydrogenase maturation protease [Deltaproteobacteria bacterium]
MKTHPGKTGLISVPRPRILIAGMGNILLRDDGVGVHAVKRFPPAGGQEYRTLEVGCAVFDALHLFDWAEKILLIDAMQAGSPPGTVYRVDSLKDMDLGTNPVSLHEFSVIQALEMIQKDPRPDVAIIGIEPESIDFGLELSETVAASLPLVWETSRQIVEDWIRDYQSRDPINFLEAVKYTGRNSAKIDHPSYLEQP